MIFRTRQDFNCLNLLMHSKTILFVTYELFKAILYPMQKISIILSCYLISFAIIFASHSVELTNGSAIKGEILLERPDTYYIDLGFDVIAVPKKAVSQLNRVDTEEGTFINETSSNKLYRVSKELSDRPIREWVEQLGEAVTLIQTPVGLGSGFVIHKDGYVVTNDHVIAGEHRISVTIFKKDENELTKAIYEKVRIVATSSELDLALLKIETESEESFDTVYLASDYGELSDGQTVFAIGSPLGLDRTVSEGIISITNRAIGGRLYLQTTTQINPGNSGGPLFNMRGEVVGVNNMKIAAIGAEGLGFSISIRVLKSFLDNLDAYAFDPRNPNTGFRYLSPPSNGQIEL